MISDRTTPAAAARARLGRGSPPSWVVFVIGLALLAAAGAAVVRTGADLSGAIDTLLGSPLWLKALVIISPAANVLAVTLSFMALQRRFARVAFGEMFDLIGSAWLLNHLPMRPGLIGRIGYHKRVHGIRVRDSVNTTVWSVVLAAVANGALLLVALLMPGAGDDAPWAWAGGAMLWAAGPTIAALAASPLAPCGAPRLITLALAARSLDVLLWYLRYGLAFSLLGVGLDAPTIALVSAVSQLATLIPLTGSGIGFREWGVGLTSTIGGDRMGIGIAADLINRAAEILIVLPIGLWCTARVSRRWVLHRRATRAGRSPEDQPHKSTGAEDPERDGPEQDPADARS